MLVALFTFIYSTSIYAAIVKISQPTRDEIEVRN